MKKLSFQRFLYFCLLIESPKALATSEFTSSLENQSVVTLKSSQLHYDDIKSLKNSQKLNKSIGEKKDRFIKHSSQDSFQNCFLTFSFDGSLNTLNDSVQQEKYLKSSENISELDQGDLDYLEGKKYYIKHYFKEAFNYFYQASKKNHVNSYYVLGHMYNYGHGVQKDTQKSLKYYHKAAGQGHEKANQFIKSLLIKSNHISLESFWEDREELSLSLPPKKRRVLEESQDTCNDKILIQRSLSRGCKKSDQIVVTLSTTDPLLIKSDHISLKRSWEDREELSLSSPLKKRRFLEKPQANCNEEILIQKPFTQSSSRDILTPPLIRSLGQIADNYDMFLVDIVGVIHDGKEAFEHSIQLINNLVKTKKVALVSNTPRPYKQPAETLNKMGLDSQIPIFTAGDMVRDDLVNKYKDQKIYHLGAERNQDILRDLDIRTTPTLDHANVVLLTQYIEENGSLEEFDPILKEIAVRKLVVLCANSDKTTTVGDKLRYCAGTLAEKIEDFKGVVQYYGKPDAKIFDLVFNKISDIEDIQKNRVLVIGDTLEKDIKGACNSQMHSLLVLTGTTAQDIQNAGQNVKTALKDLCIKQKIKPTYYIDAMK